MCTTVDGVNHASWGRPFWVYTTAGGVDHASWCIPLLVVWTTPRGVYHFGCTPQPATSHVMKAPCSRSLLVRLILLQHPLLAPSIHFWSCTLSLHLHPLLILSIHFWLRAAGRLARSSFALIRVWPITTKHSLTFLLRRVQPLVVYVRVVKWT